MTPYATLRRDVIDWLRGVLKPSIDPERAFDALFASMTPTDDGLLTEVPSHWSRTGAPVPGFFRIDRAHDA